MLTDAANTPPLELWNNCEERKEGLSGQRINRKWGQYLMKCFLVNAQPHHPLPPLLWPSSRSTSSHKEAPFSGEKSALLLCGNSITCLKENCVISPRPSRKSSAKHIAHPVIFAVTFSAPPNFLTVCHVSWRSVSDGVVDYTELREVTWHSKQKVIFRGSVAKGSLFASVNMQRWII